MRILGDVTDRARSALGDMSHRLAGSNPPSPEPGSQGLALAALQQQVARVAEAQQQQQLQLERISRRLDSTLSAILEKVGNIPNSPNLVA